MARKTSRQPTPPPETPSGPARLEQRDVRIAGAVGAVALLLYVRTMYPSVPGGDAGELIAAVGGGGVIHPPGYPLYALLGRVFVHLPWGSLAWRLNLMSGACDAAAAALLCLAAITWTRSRLAGVATASLFAFSPGVWEYAVGAEVFALNNLFVALLVLLAVLYDRTRLRRYAYGGALAFGLALSNHQTILFTGVPLTLWVLWTGRKDLFRGRTVLQLSALFLIGLLPYLELVLDGANPATVTWGVTNTWSGFWSHVFRREYGTFQLSVRGHGPTGSPSDVAWAWASDLVSQAGWWGIVLALVGFGACVHAALRRRDAFGVIAIVPPSLAVLVFVILSRQPVDTALRRAILARFWQQPDMFVFLLCGFALATAERQALSRRLALAACAGLALLQPALQFRAHDHHGDTLVRQYGAELLRMAPEGSLLITKGDLITSTLRYLQLAEGMRNDVRVVDQELLAMPWDRPRIEALYPDVRLPGAPAADGAAYVFLIRELVDLNIARFPILTCGGLRQGDNSLAATYSSWPLGLCEQLHPRSERVSIDGWVADSQAALPHIEFGDHVRAPGSWEDVVWGDYWVTRLMRANTLISVAGHDETRRGYIAHAAEILEDVLRRNPAQAPDVYKGLAIARGRAGLIETPDDRRKTAEAWRNYLRVAPKSDPQLPDIEKEIVNLTK